MSKWSVYEDTEILDVPGDYGPIVPITPEDEKALQEGKCLHFYDGETGAYFILEKHWEGAVDTRTKRRLEAFDKRAAERARWKKVDECVAFKLEDRQGTVVMGKRDG